ncbi:MAG: type VI secretion system ATPase TssH, partial [Bacteroidetes bacterium]|nr:type VI secretion system ATPase TssH [Bacteroidota bacterium]
MNLQKLTLKSQEAVQAAGEIAVSYNNQAIEESHLFAAMIQDEGGIIPEILMKLGTNMAYLKVKVFEELEKLPKVSGNTNQFLSPSLMKILDEAEKESKTLKDEYISTEHILIALSTVKSRISQLLKDNGVNKENIYKILHEIRGSQRVTDQNPEDKYQALKRYGRLLNEEAEQ